MTASSQWAVPSLACDCHMHVFGPAHIYKGSRTRAYTPTERGMDLYERVAVGLGFGRVVFVQPSAYGSDNSCMLATLRTNLARFRGVAVIDAETPDTALREMHAVGVRGVRFNVVTEGAPEIDALRAEIESVASRIAPLDWHLQFYANVGLVGLLAPLLREVGVPVVFDHMAGALSAEGLNQSGFDAVLSLLADGACWVKLSGADRVTGSSEAFSPAIPFARALIAANPGRVVWGTDWPHLGHHMGPRGEGAMPAIYRNLDDEALLATLRGAVTDEATWHRILVDNPAALYGF